MQQQWSKVLRSKALMGVMLVFGATGLINGGSYAIAQMGGPPGSMQQGQQGQQGSNPMMRQGRGPQLMMQMADTDKDSKLSRQEFMQFHEQMFTRMDLNKDGMLDPGEMQTAHRHMMQKMQNMRGQGQGHQHQGHK